jgi:hypothetical protein
LVAHGFDFDLMARLVRESLATVTPERIFAAGQPVEVLRVRITEAGWQALAEQQGFVGDCDASSGDKGLRDFPCTLADERKALYAVAYAERWLSGLRQRIFGALYGRPYRRFESFPSPP